MKRLLAALLFAVWFPAAGHAQDAQIVAVCGTAPPPYNSPGSVLPLTMDTNGKLCSNASGGGGGTPGGANTNIQFNNSGAFGGDSGLTYAGAGGVLTFTPAADTAQPLLITGGSTTGSGTSKLGLSIVGTQTTTGVIDGSVLFANILNTQSGAGTLLVDIQVGSASKFSINTSGDVISAGQLFVGNATTSNAAFFSGTNIVGSLGFSNAARVSFTSAKFLIGTGAYYGWAANLGNPATSAIWQEGTGLIGQGNPTTLTAASAYRVYNTTDTLSAAPTNFERGVLDWTTTTNVFLVGTQNGGTGSVRNMEFVIGGVNKLDFGVTAAAVWTSAVTIAAPTHQSSGSVPVDGGGTCTASSFAGGATAGTFNAAVCAGGTIAITFAFTAPTGWSCDAEDRTTPATGKLQQTVSTATKATFLATNSAADVIQYKCIAY